MIYCMNSTAHDTQCFITVKIQVTKVALSWIRWTADIFQCIHHTSVETSLLKV